VQVEAGPDPGTIMVMWLPVTITTFGLSNGAPVTGYIVYGDGKQIQDVDDPTADSAVVSIANLSVKAVTVRTKSNDKLSSESSSCPLPDNMVPSETRMSGGNDDSDSEDELIEKLQNHPVITGPTRTRELIINYSGYPDMDSDIGPSELSDIAEEPEDELTDSEDNRLSTPKILNPPKYDRTNMYKTPIVNSLNVWQPKKPETTSSQISNSQFETQKFSNPPQPTNNKNQKTEQKNSNLNGSSEYNANSVTNNRSERMRIFVALFDYDPPSMSPNPDACDEELPFREGQLIKVFGEKDADGFYWGEAGTRSGFVPCNMVSEVQVDDERVAEELFREQAGSSASQKTDRGGSVDRDDRWGDIYEDMPMKRKIALYDYDPTELSPNVDSEVELSFKTGEIIMIYGEMDDDGFYMGELNARRGLVPSNFLTDIPSGLDPKNGFRQTQPRVLGQQRVPPAGGRW